MLWKDIPLRSEYSHPFFGNLHFVKMEWDSRPEQIDEANDEYHLLFPKPPLTSHALANILLNGPDILVTFYDSGEGLIDVNHVDTVMVIDEDHPDYIIYQNWTYYVQRDENNLKPYRDAMQAWTNAMPKKPAIVLDYTVE
jgi:hypothetical protein